MKTPTTLDRDTLFKALDGRHATHGGEYKYWLKRWTPPIVDVNPCVRGYHLTRGPQLLEWLGPDLYVAEADPDYPIVDAGDKLVCGRVRIVEHLTTWNDRTARLFAADCAEAALLGERALGREPDGRLWTAVDVARRFANGDATWKELYAVRTAARYAAGAAARDVAWTTRGLMYDRLCLYLTGQPLPRVQPLYGEQG